jgi:hypothetical protein
MPDLRDLLERAAGEPPAAVPLAQIKSRGQFLRRRRQTVTGAAAAVAFAAAAVLVITSGHLHLKQPEPASEAPRPVQLVRPGVLVTGQYEDRVLEPQVSFAIPDDTTWRATRVTASSLVISSDGSPPTATVALVHWLNVVDPATGRVSTGVRPNSLVSWLATHPSLHVMSGPMPADLAGKHAEMVTFTLAADADLPAGPAPDCPDRPACLTLFETPDHAVVVGSTDQVTVVVPDDDPSGLVLVQTLHSARIQESYYQRSAMSQVVGSLRIIR